MQLFRESGLFFSRKNRLIRPKATNGRLSPADRPCGSRTTSSAYSAPAPMPARRSDLTVIGADKLGLLDNLRLFRPQHIERHGWGPQIEGRPANRQQAEVIVMSTGLSGRTRAAVAGLAKVIARLVQCRDRPVCRIARIETAGGGRNVEHGPMPEHAGRCVRVLDDKDEALCSCRHARPRQWRRDIGIVTGVLRRYFSARRDGRTDKHQRHGGSPHCPSFPHQIEIRSVGSTRSG